jgi:hypothetical protein
VSRFADPTRNDGVLSEALPKLDRRCERQTEYEHAPLWRPVVVPPDAETLEVRELEFAYPSTKFVVPQLIFVLVERNGSGIVSSHETPFREADLSQKFVQHRNRFADPNLERAQRSVGKVIGVQIGCPEWFGFPHAQPLSLRPLRVRGQ